MTTTRTTDVQEDTVTDPTTATTWRTNPVTLMLDAAMHSGDEPTPAQLDALTTQARPELEAGFREAVTAAAREVIELWESGAQGPARERARLLAGEIDTAHRTTAAVDDEQKTAKADRRSAAKSDPAALAAGVTDNNRPIRR